MSNDITAQVKYAIGDPPFLTEGVDVTMLESGFDTEIVQETTLAAGACGPVIDVAADAPGARWLTLTWRGDIDLRFDDTPGTPTLACTLPLHGSQCPPEVNQSIVLPLRSNDANAIAHVQVCAVGCGAHYDLKILAP